MFTNWLGNSTSFLLSNTAFSFAVPVVVSIWLSAVSSSPVASFCTSPWSYASTGIRLSARQLVQHLRQLILRQRKVHRDRLELVNDHQIRGVGGNDVARIHQPQSDAAVDRRLDGAPVQLQLGGLDRGLVRLDGALDTGPVSASSASIVSFDTTPAS